MSIHSHTSKPDIYTEHNKFVIGAIHAGYKNSIPGFISAMTTRDGS
jgi:hypothetical protein